MIRADNITKYYGGVAAVDHVSFSIEAGEVIGLLGLNGAGKTTTLRILSGLLVPTAGRVVIDGIDMAESPEAARSRIGFLPETPPLYPEMTVEAFLTFVGRINGVGKEIGAAVSEALAATQLEHKRHARIYTLSHGYKRRVGIASAIVHKPALILLDEPTSGLDPVQIINMRDLIRSLKSRHTVMVSSHILSEIHELCDRIFVMHEGKIRAEGTEADLARKTPAGLTLELEVRGSREALAAVLTGMSSLEEHQIRSGGDDVQVATVRLRQDTREGLVAALVAAGLGVRRLTPADSGLEAIFLKLTGPQPAATPTEEAA